MSLTSALNVSISALKVNQRSIDVLSGNIANAGTQGYTRKRVQVQDFTIGDRSLGVRASVTRELDVTVQRQLRSSASALEFARIRTDGLVRLDQMLGEPGSPGALDALFDGLASGLEALAANPNELTARTAVVDTAKLLASRLNQMTADVQAMRSDAEAQIGDAVTRVNDLLTSIADVQTRILTGSTAGQNPVGLLDQRDTLVDELSQYIDIRVTERNDGTVTIMTSGGASLLDAVASQLYFDSHGSLTAGARWNADPALSGAGTIKLVTPAGLQIDLIGDNQLRSGVIGGLLNVRDTMMVEAQNQLDALAAALALSFEPADVAGNDTAGGYSIDLAALPPNGVLNVTVNDNGTPRTISFVPATGPQPPVTANTDESRIVALDYSGSPAEIAARIQSALGSPYTVTATGTTLEVLDAGAHVVTGLSARDPSVRLLADGGVSGYAGGVTPSTARDGFAGRIQVSRLLEADPSLLVTWANGVPGGDALRPKALLERLERSQFTFGPDTALGGTNGFSTDTSSFMRQMISQRGSAAELGQRALEGQDIVHSNLAARASDTMAVDIDEELARLITLQNTYAASARVMSVVRDLFDTLLRS
jgi:flagellar hook-associated protein 1 FlgK